MMKKSEFQNLLIDQSKDLYWVVNLDFQLVYVNKAYLNFMKKEVGMEKKLNDSAFIEAFGEKDIKKWKAYYNRAFKGERFEIDKHFFHSELNETQYNQIAFEPLTNEENEIFAVACQSKNVTGLVVERYEANQIINSSLDVFCTINEQGNFVYVSAASEAHWGYPPKELIGKPYKDLILEEDVPKTNKISDEIFNGDEIKVFVNRYKKKNGDIAYNSWSSRWDDTDELFYAVARDAKEKVLQDEKIQQSEQRFRSLVQGAFDLVAIVDTEGNYTFMSPSSIKIIGVPPEEFIGKNAFDFLHPDDTESALASLKKIVTKERVIMEPYRAKNSKNEWRWVESVLTNMLKNPAVNGIVINARDITEKVLQDEKIKQSEQRFKALVQEGSDMISIIDIEGNYSYVSPTSFPILGIAPGVLIGKNAFEFIHPDDAERTLASLETLTIENTVNLEPYRFQNHKKEWRWMETVLTNMLENPAVNGIVANSRDITEKIEKENKLKLFESVITNTKDAVIITEVEPIDGVSPKITYVNEAFTRMTGYTAEDVIGNNPNMLLGPNSNREGLDKLSCLIQNWESHEMTTINYKKNGEQFWVNFTLTPVEDEKGSHTHWVSIEREVTKQKIAELEKDLINKIGTTFDQNIDDDLTVCLDNLCRLFVEFGDFDFAEIWLPAIDAKMINRIAYADKLGSVFYNTAKNLKSFIIGDGMPGSIWKNKATEVWEKGDDKWSFFKRKKAAKEAGIASVMGVPLKNKKEVVGVLLLGIGKAKSNLSLYLKLFQKLESKIGAELSRKEMEIELSQIFNFTPDMICLAGFDGYIKRMNPAGLEMLGYSLDEIRSKPISSFIHKEDQLFTHEKQKSLYKGWDVRSFENRYITKQGKTVWLSWTASSATEIGTVYAVAKNITEEKKLKELNRQAGNIAKIGSWEVDLVRQKLYWSDVVHELHGTDPKTYVPNLEAGVNFYREDFVPIVQSYIDESIATGLPFNFEAVIITTKKEERWIRSTGKAEVRDGECKRIYGSFQDIHERKEAEMRLKSLANNIPGVVFQYFFYPDGTEELKYVTEGSQQLWGYSAEEVIENNQLVWERIRAAGDFDVVRNSISDALTSKSQWTCRFRYLMPSGELRTHLGIGTPTFLTNGTILFHSVLLDVTQEAKNEALLEQTTQIARVGSWEMNLIGQEGDDMYWSPMIKEILEIDESYSPTLREGIEFHIGESRERIQRAIDLLINEGTEFDEEILIRTAKGNERWNRAIGKCEMVNNKRTKIYGSYQDIHEKKLAAISLEESLKTLRDYKFSLDQAAIIAFTDKKGIITSVNDNFCEISKYERKEVIGKTHRLINSEYHPTTFFKDLWKKIGSGKVWRGEIKNKAKDGSYYWVDTTIVPFLDDKNNPIQYLAIRIDITERKKAEQERVKFLGTLENSLNEIYLFDAKSFKFSYVNNGALLNLGYSKQEMKALTPLDLEPDLTGASFKELVTPLLNSEKDKVILFKKHKRKDGSTYPVEVHLQLVIEGDKRSFLAVILDITERKKAEQEKNNLQTTLENSLNEIYIFDADSLQFSYVNKGALSNLGYSEEEINKLTLLDIKPDFITTTFKELVAPLVNYEKEKIIFFTNHKRKDGSIYPVEVHLQLVSEGNNIRFLAVILDITERKKAEEDILQANERFKKVTEATNDAIWDWDLVNDTFYRSTAIERFFGENASRSLCEDDFWKENFHPNDLELIKQSIHEAISNPLTNRWELEYRILNDYGKILYINDRGVIIRNSKGKAIRMVGAMTDISDQKQMSLELRELNQELQQHTLELERSNEELEQFAFVASHDLQEPLRMISSFMDLLKLKYEDKLDEKGIQYIHFATDGAKRMKQIILDLLDYSRAGKLAEGKEEVDLNDIISEFKLLRRKLISEINATITTKNLPKLITSKAAVTQIIHCLIDNSLKYSKEGTAPIVMVNAEETDTEWKFSIIDNGIGIDPQFYDKIFLIFQRLHNKDKYTGTGIGLSIAKRHVEILGGRIWLEPGPKEGTIFYFTIPKIK